MVEALLNACSRTALRKARHPVVRKFARLFTGPDVAVSDPLLDKLEALESGFDLEFVETQLRLYRELLLRKPRERAQTLERIRQLENLRDALA